MGRGDNDGLDFPAPDRPSPDDVSDLRLIHPFTAPAMEAEGDRAFIVVPTPPPVMSDSVWHYTDISGAVGILDQGCLWATSLLLLNDRQEMLYGVELLQSLRPGVESSKSFQPMQRRFILEVIEMTEIYLFNNHLFVLCAATSRDSLSQWRAYSNGSGYAIGLNPRVDMCVYQPSEPVKYTSMTPVSSGWRTVLYSHEDQIRLLRSLIGFVGAACPAPGGPGGTQEFAARTQELVPFLASAVAYLKHPAFEEEREVRSVFAVDDLKPTPVHFRASRLGVTPYVSCAVGGEPRDENRGLALTTASKTRLPVTEVMIGPTADREAARRGVMAILEARGYKAIEVSWSDSPYR